MKKFLIHFFVVLLSMTVFLHSVYSNETKIIEIKRSLSLNNNKQHNKEFYINAGSNHGLKIKHIIPVVRRKSFYDPLLNQSIGDLWLPVGDLKIIYVGKKVSIARIHKVPERKILPEVEYNTFMIGDRLRINKSRFLKRNHKKKSAKNKSKNGMRRGIASVSKNSDKFKKDKFSFSKAVRNEMNKSSTKTKPSDDSTAKFSRGSVSRQFPVQAK